MFTQCGARITQAYDTYTKTWCGFEIKLHRIREINRTHQLATSQGGQLVFIANKNQTCLLSWPSSRLKRVARSSSVADTEPAADGGDEAIYIRLCLKEVLFRQLDLEARQIPAALVDCRGVYDAVARSSSSCLDLQDKQSGLEGLLSNKVLLSVARYVGVILLHSWVMLQQKTLI